MFLTIDGHICDLEYVTTTHHTYEKPFHENAILLETV